MTNPFLFTFQFVIGMILMVACQKPVVQEETIMKVGTSKVSAQEFRQRLIEKSRNYDALLIQEKNFATKLKKEVINELTIEGLLLSWEEDTALSIDGNVLREEIQKISSSYPSPQVFHKTLQAHQLSQASIEKRVRARLIKERLVKDFSPSPNVDMKKVKQKYWLDKEAYVEAGKIKLQQIVLKTEYEANTVYQSLKKGALFGDVAKKYSIAAEAPNEGRLGWVQKGTLPVFDKAFKLPLGRVSKPVLSPYGYHIFRVSEKMRRRKLPLDEVKRRLSAESIQKQKSHLYTQWLEKQLMNKSIEIDDEAIENAKIVTKRILK